MDGTILPKTGVKVPSAGACEVTSFQILQRSYRRHRVVPMRTLHELWRHLGHACAAILTQGKGLRLPGFLELTLDSKGKPAYLLESDPNKTLQVFGSGHSVKWKAAHRFLIDNETPIVATLPYASVTKALNAGKKRRVTRKQCEKACIAVFSELIRAARGPCRSLFLTLASVGEIVYTSSENGEGLGAQGFIAVRYRKDFVTGLINADAAKCIKNPVHRATVAARFEAPEISIREYLVPSLPVQKKLLPAPGTPYTDLHMHSGNNSQPCTNFQCLVDDAKRVMTRIRDTLTGRHGVLALHLLYKALQVIDDDELDVDEIRWGFRDHGVELSQNESLNLVKNFDRDGGGTLSIDEFMDGLCGGPLSKKRTDIIRRLFAKLQALTESNDGESLPIEKLRPQFNPWADPRVKTGDPQWPAPEFSRFFFGLLDDTHDGIVDYSEFLKLHRHLSPAVPSDDAFKATCLAYWNFAEPHEPESEDDLLAPGPLTRQEQREVEIRDATDVYLDRILDAKKVAHNLKKNFLDRKAARQGHHPSPPPPHVVRLPIYDEDNDTSSEASLLLPRPPPAQQQRHYPAAASSETSSVMSPSLLRDLEPPRPPPRDDAPPLRVYTAAGKTSFNDPYQKRSRHRRDSASSIIFG